MLQVLKFLLALTLPLFHIGVFAQTQWQEGDLIFRTGTQTVSDLVMLADESGYSHVGMLIGTPENWQVLHATPEEVPGRGSKVVLDDLAFFIAPERSKLHHIFRVDAAPQEREIAVQWAMAQIGQPFSLLDPDGIYCTTLIWKAFGNASVDLQVEFTSIRLPLLSDGNFLLPSGLVASPLVSPVISTE